ncbi:MAG: glycosyltransferase family 2 protein [Chloroflexi bacterium]|nr:glycosyltransferase family 2 protein [Chloroflexota bacterium]
MTNSNITVIVPTYNRVALLQETLQSVLDQTYPVLEIIVVDNGGTDSTEQMISQLHDARIRYERIEPSGGPAKPRNYGAAMARGSVISFLDSDDLWKPTKIEDELTFWKKTDADIITCLAREYIHGREGPLVRYPIKEGYLSYRDVALDNPVVGANFSINKNLFLRIGGFDEDIRLAGAEDKDFLVRASVVASFGVVRKVKDA